MWRKKCLLVTLVNLFVVVIGYRIMPKIARQRKTNLTTHYYYSRLLKIIHTVIIIIKMQCKQAANKQIINILETKYKDTNIIMPELSELPSNDTPSSSTDKDKNVEAEKPETNILDYTNQKVIVYNMPKYAKEKEIKSYIVEWTSGTSIEVMKHKKVSKQNWLVLTLGSKQMVDEMMNIINDGNHTNKKGGVLRATRAADRNDKREREGDNGRSDDKRRKIEEYVKTDDEIRDAVTPLWKLTYEEQVKLKMRKMINKSLSKIIKEINAKIRFLRKDKQRNQAAHCGVYRWLKEKQPVAVQPIKSAPKQFKYRNKSEMTFGFRHFYSEDTNQDSEQNGEVQPKKVSKIPAVGFMAGGWHGGVSSPHCLANIPDIVCGIADIVDEFLRDSPVPVYLIKEHRGVWRTITIRSSDRTNQCMITVCHAPPSGGLGAKEDGSDDCTDIFESEKQRLVKMLTQKISKPSRNLSSSGAVQKQEDSEEEMFCHEQVTSIFFQEFEGVSNPSPQHPVQHSYGKQFLEEKLLQCTFQISPGAFFQVTTEGAEVLYQVVVDKLKEVTPNPKETLLFDVCCGTGTIGLTCMKEGAVGKVVGIDIAEPAIKDAKINAERNGYAGSDGNAVFVASRAEKAMHNEIKKADRSVPMVAVVDPAREGLHQDVCKALRNARNINRIIYVSCNPTGSLIKDATSFCTPETKKYSGRPFKISSAQPVDMFPLTDHCEMVMVFDRMSVEEANNEDERNKVNTKAATTTEAATAAATTTVECCVKEERDTEAATTTATTTAESCAKEEIDTEATAAAAATTTIVESCVKEGEP